MAAPWFHGSLSESIKEDPYFSSQSHLIVKDILSGDLTLIKFVEQLDGVLTDLRPDIRKRGTQVLSDILKGLPTNFLSEEELNFISTFYSFCLKDQHEVLPAVFQGILAVCKMDNLPKTTPFNICSTLFLHVSCQSQLQSDRLLIYQIVHLMTTKHLENVKMMGPDFVYGVISSVDGERDPRNLLFIFNMFPDFLRNLPPQHLTEEAFEVIACYFPVDFNPTSEDPNGITREDLSRSLAPCLTAIPEFAEFCLPLLLEKLDSELRLSKLDSLRLLEEASTRFNVESLAPHISAVWFSISRESLQNGDREIREAAQNALMALLRKLGSAPVDSDVKQDPMRLLLGDVLSACASALSQVQTTLFLPSSQLLVAAARATSASCYIVCVKVLPLILSYFLEKDDSTEKVVLLQTMTILLSVAHSLQVTPKDFSELRASWSSIAEVYLRSALDTDRGLQQEALLGLIILLPSLEQKHVADLIKTLLKLIDTNESFDTRDVVYNCLTAMAKLYPHEVQTDIVNMCMSRGDSSDLTFERRTVAMCRLATVQSFTSSILTGVISSIVNAPEDFSSIKAYFGGLRSLLDAIHQDGETRDAIHKHLLECGIVSSLVKWWLRGVSSQKVPDIFSDLSLLETSALVLAQITCHQSVEEQNLNLSLLPGFFSASDFCPWSPESPVQQTRMVLLLESILGTLRLSIDIPGIVDGFRKILNLGLKTNDSVTRCSALRLCASLINKSENEITGELLSLASGEIDAALADLDTVVRIKATATLSWITKALVLRGHKESETWTHKIIELLADPAISEEPQTTLSDSVVEGNLVYGTANLSPSVGYQAANSIKLILQDSPIFLTAHSHCHVKSSSVWKANPFKDTEFMKSVYPVRVGSFREGLKALTFLVVTEMSKLVRSCVGLLYKQRFFQVTPFLASAFSSAPESVRTHYLVALAYLLEGVPTAVLKTNLPLIMPLLLQSLSKTEPLLLLAVLNTLQNLIPEKMHHDILSSDFQTMLPRLIPLTLPPLPMKVRIAALRCLGELSTFSLPLILPFKEEVVNDLKSCLNDPKRLVRQEAVKTRSRWILCDAFDSK